MQANHVVQLLKDSDQGGGSALKLRDVAMWVEEHTNLCTTFATLAGGDPEVRKRMSISLRKSVERGKNLMGSLIAKEEMQGSETLTVDANRRRPAAIPLSGFHRFEEAPFAPSRSNLARPAVMANQISSSASLPSPSRTYVKKTVS